MSLLSNLRPLLRGNASIAITLSAASNDGLTVLIQPKLLHIDTSTTDPVRSALQAALAQPIRLVIPADADPDAVLANALQRVNTVRAPMVDDLQTYLDGLAQAALEAKVEAEKAAEKKKTAKNPAAKPAGKAGTKAAPVSAAASADDEEDDGEGTDTGGSTAEQSAPAPATAAAPSEPAPLATASLFD